MTGLRLSTRIEALESASFDAGELYERACESKDLNVYSQYKRKFRQACMLLFSVSRDVEQLEAKAARYDARERWTKGIEDYRPEGMLTDESIDIIEQEIDKYGLHGKAGSDDEIFLRNMEHQKDEYFGETD